MQFIAQPRRMHELYEQSAAAFGSWALEQRGRFLHELVLLRIMLGFAHSRWWRSRGHRFRFRFRQERTHEHYAQNHRRPREIRLAHRLHSYFGRMRHWPWQRMAFPVCMRRIWRRGVCAALPGVLGDSRPAYLGHGIRRGPREPKKLRAKLRHFGTRRHQMALV